MDAAEVKKSMRNSLNKNSFPLANTNSTFLFFNTKFPFSFLAVTEADKVPKHCK